MAPYDPTAVTWTAQDTIAKDRLKKAHKYVDSLHELGIADEKLTYAYEMLMECHLRIWRIARTAIQNSNRHCDDCHKYYGGRAFHLDRAIVALDQREAANRRMYGVNHKLVSADQTKRNELHGKRNQP